MIGIQTSMLKGSSFKDVTALFLELQAKFRLSACEIHLERSLYASAVWPWDDAEGSEIALLRSAVDKFGVHLPFMDLNPVSANIRIVESGRRIFEESLEFAARAKADYVVFHARGRRGGTSTRVDDLLAWRDFISLLNRRAVQLGLDFCLENADDLKNLQEIRDLLEHTQAPAWLCLDIGHMFEREYGSSFLPRMACRLNDCFSPFPFAWKRGLPLPKGHDWPGSMRSLQQRIACVHVHNHDGRSAHQTLRRGKINLEPLRNFRDRFRKVPVILEADYTRCSFDEIGEDIAFLEGLLS
jgi:endonuclease IV